MNSVQNGKPTIDHFALCIKCSLIGIIWIGCASNESTDASMEINSNTDSALLETSTATIQFEQLTAKQTGITFANNIVEEAQFNYWNYLHFYNGGGVAIGDLNNDELPDIFFTGNQVGNQIYLNNGDLKFSNITKSAGIIQDDAWNTGVSMIDINNDGWLDIYVCRSGLRSEELRQNLLYINNGDLTFTERASTYGLGDRGYSTEAAFFDFNKDGLLDVYLINHPIDYKSNGDIRPFQDGNFPAFERDKLFQQVSPGKFKDISIAAGINNWAWGLSVSISDINGDSWPDIYVANDFLEPDFMYMNNGDGTFTDRILKKTKHISFNSMGSDIADMNNDGLMDILVVDMLPQTNKISKTMMASMRPAEFRGMITNGNHHQYMTNTLQINQENGQFSEVGLYAGISKTDWSWAVLAADLNNNGSNDIFITNGIKRDVTDNDLKAQINRRSLEGDPINSTSANAMTRSRKVKNLIFENTGSLRFNELTDAAGFNEAINSNGASYADLDLDGDLDLVLNNMDAPASIFENKNEGNSFLRFRLIGPETNRNGIGSKVIITVQEHTMVREQFLTRGFLSSVEPILHFGMGQHRQAEKIKIIWPDGKIQELVDIPVGQILTLSYDNARPSSDNGSETIPQIFKEVFNSDLDFLHEENPFDDFKREILLPHKRSQNGPFMAVGDVNGDQLQALYIGGAYTYSGAMFLQDKSGKFSRTNSTLWKESENYEDQGCLFFDADSDGDQDLYVVSGGNETDAPANIQDRLYLNDGSGDFSFNADRLPGVSANGSCVIAADIDGDNDLDLFVGGRAKPGLYPMPDRSFILRNNNGHFQDITALIAPELSNIGIVSDAVWTDFNQDGRLDLVVVGEWMAIRFFENQGGHFQDVTSRYYLQDHTGWWNSIVAEDIDNDGDIDLVVGNIGMNNKFQPSFERPLHLYAHDFDDSGNLDIVLAKYSDDQLVPLRGRECSSDQMPFILDKFPTYAAFGDATIQDVYGDKLNEAYHLTATFFYSIILLNNGSGYEVLQLPTETQLSPVNGILVGDYNNDGITDLLLVGNRFGAEPETVRYDAGNGCLLLGTGMKDDPFTFVPGRVSGFNAPKNAKSLVEIELGISPHNQKLILIGNNSDKMQTFAVEKKPLN